MPAPAGAAFQVCAPEGGTCQVSVPSVIAYGADLDWNVRVGPPGTVACNNAVFSDPAPNRPKTCRIAPLTAFAMCAAEGQPCAVPAPAVVIYGADTRWVGRVVQGQVACSNTTFTDPAPGVGKACRVVPLALAPANQALLGPRPALSPADMRAVISWIAQDVSNSRQSFCWRDSYGRGVGKPLSTCPADTDKDGLLCYPKCRAGFNGVGPVCWQSGCPGGFRDDGAFCAKPGPYGVGGGYPWKFGDGLNDRGMYSRCQRDHGSGNCEKSGAIVYPKCRPGFVKVGCCICSPACPSGMTDIGVSCAKQSYGRSAGTPMRCAAGEQEDAGLCYGACRPGFNGVGPVCWGSCPAGKRDCGAGCANDTATCATDTAGMVTAPLVLAANIVSFGAATPGTKAASMAAKAPKAFDALKRAGNAANMVMTASDIALLTKDVAESTASWVDDFVADWRNVTTERVQREVDARFRGEANLWVKRQYALSHFALLAQQNGIATAQNTLSVVAMVDPTGVVGIVDAFAKPVCKSDAPFPNVRPLY